jgi:nucleoside phosphorylase
MENQARANPFRSTQELPMVQVPRVTGSRQDYTIAWICALPLELAASRDVLDEEHARLPNQDGDDNTYVLGRIGRHNVVMASLPGPGRYGTNNAAIVWTNLKRSFSNIRATLVVGIGGGCPSHADLYLGDVVVGTSVVQYDMGKVVAGGRFEITAVAKTPAQLLASAVSTLASESRPHPRSRNQRASSLESRLSSLPRPDRLDCLFQASYEHHPFGAPTCDGCDLEKLQPRRRRLSSGHEPQIHYGVIASGNRVIRDAKTRDDIAQQLSVLCFEMEAAGMMDIAHCLPIRGICDYSDSHKNKEWQGYAAATAAAYAKALLEVLPPAEKALPPAEKTLPPKHRRTTLGSFRGIAKSQLESYAHKIWEGKSRTRQWIVLFLVLLVSASIIGPCAALLPKKAETTRYVRQPAARWPRSVVSLISSFCTSNNQETILPQTLSSADLNGQTFLFARGRDGHLLFTTRERGSWTLKWNRTGQQTQSPPTSMVWGNPKRMSVFYIRDDNMVMTNALYGGAWGVWEPLGAKVSSPAVLCHEARADIIHVWVREDAQSKLIRHNYWEPTWGSWHALLSSDWESSINEGVAKGASGAPAVVCRNSTTATNDVVIYDKESGSPLHKQWNNTSDRWGPWRTLDGLYLGDPVLVSPEDDRLDFFGISRNSKSLIHISWTLDLGYTGPRDLQGLWRSTPSVVVTASGRLDVFILSTNGKVMHRSLLGSTWSSDWSDLGISAASAPLATRLSTAPPQIMLHVIGMGGAVLSSEWEATDDGGLKNVVPVMQIGDGLS